MSEENPNIGQPRQVYLTRVGANALFQGAQTTNCYAAPSIPEDLTYLHSDVVGDLDHEHFGFWLDAGPSAFDQLRSDEERLKYVLERIHAFRKAIGTDS